MYNVHAYACILVLRLSSCVSMPAGEEGSMLEDMCVAVAELKNVSFQVKCMTSAMTSALILRNFKYKSIYMYV